MEVIKKLFTKDSALITNKIHFLDQQKLRKKASNKCANLHFISLWQALDIGSNFQQISLEHAVTSKESTQSVIQSAIKKLMIERYFSETMFKSYSNNNMNYL